MGRHSLFSGIKRAWRAGENSRGAVGGIDSGLKATFLVAAWASQILARTG